MGGALGPLRLWRDCSEKLPHGSKEHSMQNAIQCLFRRATIMSQNEVIVHHSASAAGTWCLNMCRSYGFSLGLNTYNSKPQTIEVLSSPQHIVIPNWTHGIHLFVAASSVVWWYVPGKFRNTTRYRGGGGNFYVRGPRLSCYSGFKRNVTWTPTQ